MTDELTSDRTTFERSVRTVIASYSVGERFSTSSVIWWIQEILPEIRNPQADVGIILNYIRVGNLLGRGLREYAENIPPDGPSPPIPPKIEEEIDRSLFEARLKLGKNLEKDRARYSAVDSYLAENQETLGIKCVASGKYTKIEEGRRNG